MKEYYILINQHRYTSVIVEDMGQVERLLETFDINPNNVVIVEATSSNHWVVGTRTFTTLTPHN